MIRGDAMEIVSGPIDGHPDALLVKVTGEVDSTTSERFREELVALVSEDVRHLILDFGDVTYINSSGLGALVAAYKRARSVDGSLILCRVRGTIAAVMSLIRLDKMIDTHDSLEAALATLA